MNINRKPFHGVVLEMIPFSSDCELQTIGRILTRVIIPKDHEEIAAAWNIRCKEMGWSDTDHRCAGVEESILQQKQGKQDSNEKGKHPDRQRIEHPFTSDP